MKDTHSQRVLTLQRLGCKEPKCRSWFKPRCELEYYYSTPCVFVFSAVQWGQWLPHRGHCSSRAGILSVYSNPSVLNAWELNPTCPVKQYWEQTKATSLRAPGNVCSWKVRLSQLNSLLTKTITSSSKLIPRPSSCWVHQSITDKVRTLSNPKGSPPQKTCLKNRSGPKTDPVNNVFWSPPPEVLVSGAVLTYAAHLTTQLCWANRFFWWFLGTQQWTYLVSKGCPAS